MKFALIVKQLLGKSSYWYTKNSFLKAAAVLCHTFLGYVSATTG